MRRSLSSSTPLIAGLLASLLFAILVVPLMAQPMHESPSSYDIRKEVTLKGTVSSVLHKPTDGMTSGSHLLLSTGYGKVDAALGKWALVGKGHLSVSIGDEVEVAGVVKTYKGNEVFVVRTVKSGGQVYTIRDQRGAVIPPQAREHASENIRKGGFVR